MTRIYPLCQSRTLLLLLDFWTGATTYFRHAGDGAGDELVNKRKGLRFGGHLVEFVLKNRWVQQDILDCTKVG